MHTYIMCLLFPGAIRPSTFGAGLGAAILPDPNNMTCN